METSEDFIKRLKNDIFDTLVYVEDSMREANEIKDKTFKVVEQLNRLPIKDDKDMEEKKTKRMTKAEAFEWLKCKKVDTIGLGEEVMKKLFDCGVKWANGKCEYYDFSDYLLIEHNGDLYHCGNCGEAYWRAHHFEEIYAQDILSMEIIDENKSEEEKDLDKISCLGAQIMDILLHMKGHPHVTITETTVALHDEGMCLFHSDPF